MIVFNRDKRYDQLIGNGFDDGINKSDLILLSRRWTSDGLDAENVKHRLIEFCTKWVDNFNKVKYEQLISDCVKIATDDAELPERPETISFSAEELQTIAKARTEDARRLLFIMCCVCKFYGRTDIYLNSKSKVKLYDLCKLAKTKCKIKEQNYILHDLYVDFLMTAREKILHFDLPIEESVNHELEFEPSEQMIDEWVAWFKTHYSFCQMCGRQIEKTNNRVKYCKECAVKVNKEQTARRNKES